jgi:predicted  nucleic acid-binding Zn ribbon protein
MFVVKGIFNPTVSLEPEQVQEVTDLLLDALSMDGQIPGREFPS